MAEFVWQNETLKQWGLQKNALEHSTATKFYLFQADMNELFVLTIEGIWIVGIKPDFPFINICKVPREMLKTLGFARRFQHLPRDLSNVNEWMTKSCLIAFIA